MVSGIELAEKGLIPDPILKFGIRKLLTQRLAELPSKYDENLQDYTSEIISQLRKSPVAIETSAANDQHYELPPEFFKLCLGKHLKYSSCYYEKGARNLDEAERDMLALTCERAEIRDGMDILDLGCGWGSLSLWIAEKYPNCTVTSVSNSAPQRMFIEGQAKQRGLDNIKVITADMNEFWIDQTFDRVTSIEMFEHMRNYETLMEKISKWLREDGKLFIHIFCHKLAPYYFETEGEDNWMGAYFFTGGIMPSHHLLLYFQKNLAIDKHWIVNGKNYEKTSLDWLANMDKNKKEILELFKRTYGDKDAAVWFQRWRIFYLSCAELFGFRNGEEWWVSHYLFEKRSET